MLFYYIRHGDPIYDPDMLTPLGQEQAKAVAKRLCLHGVDRVFASPSNRAMQTAQPTCDLLKKKMTICDWAHEQHAWNDFAIPIGEGRRTWCFHNNRMIQAFHHPEVRALGNDWYKHPSFSEFQFGKGVERINEAIDAFFLELGYRHDRENARFEVIKSNSDRVALFAHQGFGMSFFSSLLDIPYPVFCTHFDFGHSSMSVIHFEECDGYVYPRVLQLANDSHLYREGILTGYHNAIHF